MTASDRHGSIVDTLLASAEPSIRWKVRTQVLGEAPGSPEITELRTEIQNSVRVRRLLAPCLSADPPPVYAKWQGPHWTLTALADLGHPPGDKTLHPLRDQILTTWLDESYYLEFEAATKSAAYRGRGVPVMRARHRRCASQQGNALWSLTTLGLADDRCDALVERLLHWQWPDGGWNCDKNPAADTSSFYETLPPMRGLAAYAATDSAPAASAARRAAEVLLTRRLAYRVSTGTLIHPEFAKLHYPLYWHYDILGGLKAMAALGLLGDDRCTGALDLLESLRLPDGWPAHARYYKVSDSIALHHDSVDWGGTSTRRTNPWVTADALAVLHAAGRLRL
ncbi:hypothetical protein [Sphaerisporangium aureirubrum]|uniref:Prenyltransferase n=1 Tax=Sphaerisporangium aureirubrum TaxID=1544736 RepID=A0ABW1NL21_9ACTN